MQMSYCETKSARLAYKVFGTGKIDVVIEGALNSCCAEWWHIAERLSAKHAVLVYDRAGYGTSSESALARTPRNIADELAQLLSSLSVADKVILIGHSQGGLYAQQFARMNREMVRGILLIDPLSAGDSRFWTEFTPKECRQGGIDKMASQKAGLALTRLGLGFLLKPLLRKAPPFYYYSGFSKDATDYILSALTKPRQYKTAIAEYTSAHKPENLAGLTAREGFPNVPLVLITHTSEIAIKENMHFGGVTREFATRVERVWQEVMKEYLSFSPHATFIRASHSSHFVHLTEPELIEAALRGTEA